MLRYASSLLRLSAFSYEIRIFFQPGSPDSFQITGKTFFRKYRIPVFQQKCDPLKALFGKMEYRLLRPFFIIGVHPACFLFHNRRFSQNHKRTFIPHQHLHQAGTHTIGRQDQPVHLFLQNQLLHGRYTHTAVIIGYQQIITI